MAPCRWMFLLVLGVLVDIVQQMKGRRDLKRKQERRIVVAVLFDERNKSCTTVGKNYIVMPSE